MSGFENWPAPILRRWLLSAAAGPVIFLIGLAGRIALHDPTLLTLSTLLASCMVVRCILLFQAIRHGDYETVEGVCVAMTGRNIRQAQILIEVVVMSKITEKIAKLLALAESPYEEEAKAALLQARRLMAEHKLMPEDIEPQENKKVIQECVGVTCTKLSSPWTVYLSTLIAAHYCCRPYRSSVHGSKVSEIGFIGMEDDFKLCKLAFLYAYDCIASRCRQIRTQKGYPAKTLREMCNSYGWGFCRGLSAAFQRQEAEHQEWGLVMVVPQAVEDAVSKMKRSNYKISPQSSINRQYAAMGYADGQEFDMRRRLEPSA